MNYYEELGVPRSASLEEIRQAYKMLARLLHPDPIQDEKLRSAAERQMTRLNGILAVLSDPPARRGYDASLNRSRSPCARLAAPPRTLAWWTWSIAVGAAAAAVWYSAGFFAAAPAASSRATVPALAPARPADAASAGEQASLAAENRLLRLEAERLRARLKPCPSSGEPSAVTIEPPSEIAVSDLAPAPVPQSPTAAGAPQPATPASGLAGTWFFAARERRLPDGQSVYPPLYIETVIYEDGGVVHGRYRARYHVPDRAISPDVAFQFTGSVGRDDPVLAWSAPGGGKGEVRLKLLSADSLEVAWVATDLGRDLGLASGTAVLIRRRDP